MVKVKVHQQLAATSYSMHHHVVIFRAAGLEGNILYLLIRKSHSQLYTEVLLQLCFRIQSFSCHFKGEVLSETSALCK